MNVIWVFLCRCCKWLLVGVFEMIFLSEFILLLFVWAFILALGYPLPVLVTAFSTPVMSFLAVYLRVPVSLFTLVLALMKVFMRRLKLLLTTLFLLLLLFWPCGFAWSLRPHAVALNLYWLVLSLHLLGFSLYFLLIFYRSCLVLLLLFQFLPSLFLKHCLDSLLPDLMLFGLLVSFSWRKVNLFYILAGRLF